MFYESKTHPKRTNHIVSLTAEDVRLAIKEAVKKEYPDVHPRPKVRFMKDMFGKLSVDVSWVEIEK